MESRNLVSVNDCFGPPYLIWNAGTFYLSMTVFMVPIPYTDGRDLISLHDLSFPITYMECRNLVTVNECYGSPKLIWNAGPL